MELFYCDMFFYLYKLEKNSEYFLSISNIFKYFFLKSLIQFFEIFLKKYFYFFDKILFANNIEYNVVAKLVLLNETFCMFNEISDNTYLVATITVLNIHF